MMSSNFTESVYLTINTKMAHFDRPIHPDFSFLTNTSENMVSSAYLVMNKKEGWDLLVNFDETSFMTCENPSILMLMSSINENYNGHSGASLAWTMRQLQYIAKNGYTKYRDLFDSNVE